MNIRTDDISKAVRVDRRTKWGNPYILHDESERDKVVEQYRQYLWTQISGGKVSLEELAALHGKDLACWCAPRRCHAERLERAAAWAHTKLNGGGA